jgi:hypothetical protein
MNSQCLDAFEIAFLGIRKADKNDKNSGRGIVFQFFFGGNPARQKGLFSQAGGCKEK